MATIVTCSSKWKHVESGKTCTIQSTREISSSKADFVISGYNPLPCFSFKGTYLVLAEWLKANGWVRIFNEYGSRADLIVIRQN